MGVFGRALFGTQKSATPVVQPPPATPTREDPEIAAARKKARQEELKRRGRRATILTGGQGVTSEALGSTPLAGTTTLG